jgi:hypothetical protein
MEFRVDWATALGSRSLFFFSSLTRFLCDLGVSVVKSIVGEFANSPTYRASLIGTI